METCSLELECFPDDLSPIQLEAYEKAEKEHNEIREKLNIIMRGSSSENIFSGNIFSAYQLTGLVTGLENYAKAPAAIRTQNRKIVKSLKEHSQGTIQIEDDEVEDWLPLSNRIAPATKRQKNVPKTNAKKPEKEPPRASPKPVVVAPIQISKIQGQMKPSESNSSGGLTVGVKNKQVVVRIGVDAQEMSFNKLQGKTYPSLVVFVRPTLIPRDKFPNNRADLDGKVKTILMYPPAKFTEWLIQQGLVRSEQKCNNHAHTSQKLGLYSDIARFPFSGGYVWISQCCPNIFTSVFNGSIFEGSPQNPAVLLKLIYHWSVQTNIQNVVQWVKVDNLFIKDFFTHLRAICTATLYTHSSIFGGPGKKIEVGVISLGTSSSDGAQRQVKVEVLGIYDPVLKQIRLRAIEPLPYSEKVYRKRFLKILEPLVDWVHEESVILTDLTVDKATLHNYGFRKVIQSNPVDVSKNPKMISHSNVTIMDYLRRVVPRMFQNTLSLLNRAIIQQFLDELVWREIYGNTPNDTFENILGNIAEQTRVTTKDRLCPRLTKMAANPFKNWSHPGTLAAATPTKPKPTPASIPIPPTPTPIPTPIPPVRSATKRKRSPPRPSTSRSMPPPAKAPKPSQPLPPVSAAPPPVRKAAEVKRTVSDPKSIRTTVESYYFGIYNPMQEEKKDSSEEVVFEIKCPECELTFVTNLELQDHLFDHLFTTPRKYQCRYCFFRLEAHDQLMNHIMVKHPMEVRPDNHFYDLICEQKYTTMTKFTFHMTTVHQPSELPYRCGVCSFASSCRRITIDHFYEEHGKSATLQCMVCLQVFVCANRERGVLMDNVNAFLAHIRAHRSNRQPSNCPRCMLQFESAGRMRSHLYMDHLTMAGKNLEPIGKGVTTMIVPKKGPQNLNVLNVVNVVESTKGLTLDVPNGQRCLECGQDFDAPNHIIGLVHCNKCGMQTHCLASAMDHNNSCRGLGPVKSNMLAQKYLCICQYATDDGNLMAKHLIMCNKKSAYATPELVNKNKYKSNMLDELGLVRKENSGTKTTTATTLEGLVMELGESTEHESVVEETVVEEAVVEESIVPTEGENDSYLDTTYDPNLSLADLGPPPPSVIVAHSLPRDEYKDLATPQVSEEHMMDYGHAEEVIEEVEIQGEVETYQTY